MSVHLVSDYHKSTAKGSLSLKFRKLLSHMPTAYKNFVPSVGLLNI